MRRSLGLLIFVSVLLLATSASAAIIDVDSVTGAWQNPNPVAGITISNGAPTSTISWGVPAGTDQSSYVFFSQVPPPKSVTVPPSPSIWLDFGDFTHNNQPIFPPSLTSTELALTLAMEVDGTPVNQSFVYTFNHEETPNVAPCAYGGLCNDRVTVNSPSAGAFNVGGTLYTLELRFSTDGGLTTSNQFITLEGQANPADLFGRFTAENVPGQVPEPGTMLLIGSGLAGLWGFRRKIKK